MERLRRLLVLVGIYEFWHRTKSLFALLTMTITARFPFRRAAVQLPYPESGDLDLMVLDSPSITATEMLFFDLDNP